MGRHDPGLEDLHELENEVEEYPLLAMFCTIENEDTPSTFIYKKKLTEIVPYDLYYTYHPNT